MEEQNITTVPKNDVFPISIIFFRFIAGFFSGVIGTVILGLILFLTWSIVGDTLNQPTDLNPTIGIQLDRPPAHPLFVYIVVFGVFIASLLSNISYTIGMNMLEEKYENRATSITQVFLSSVIILIIFLPAYIFANASFQVPGVAFAAILHTGFCAIFTYIVLETLTQTKYLLVRIYGIILGIAMFFVLESILLDTKATIAIFLSLPFLHGLLGMGNGISEGVYHWFFKTYANDFLHSERRFGQDYGVDEGDYIPGDEDL